MTVVGENGGKKEWEALVKVYDWMYSSYPDFCKQVEEFGFSAIEANDKDELILELENQDSDIIVDSDKVIRLLKKAGLKKFSKIGSLTLDKILEYDYNMAKGLLNILVRRGKGGTLSMNLHFYYESEDFLPSVEKFLRPRGKSSWSKEGDLGSNAEIFNNLLVRPLHNEGLHWFHMDGEDLKVSVISNNEVLENKIYGEDTVYDVKLETVLKVLGTLFEFPVKEIFLLGDEVREFRYIKNDDGEITVSVY